VSGAVKRKAAPLVVFLLAACATVRAPAARFAVECNVADAAVIIDDTMAGRVTEWAPPGRSISAGFHRIEIRHPSYYSHYAEVSLPEGRGAVIKAELHRLLE
jgi:hypothetical protein